MLMPPRGLHKVVFWTLWNFYGGNFGCLTGSEIQLYIPNIFEALQKEMKKLLNLAFLLVTIRFTKIYKHDIHLLLD